MDDDEERLFDRVAAALARPGSRLVATLVPEGTPVPVARRRLIGELRTRKVYVNCVAIDPQTSLATTVASAIADSSCRHVLVHGFELVGDAATRDYLRRSSFERGRLRQVSAAVLVVLPMSAWSWLARELPDLARWFDGPFELLEAPSSIAQIHKLRPYLGGILTPELDLSLDRGCQIDVDAIIERAETQLVVVGGPRGVGRTHLAVKVQQQLATRGRKCVWPPARVLLDGRELVGPPDLVLDADVPSPKVMGRSKTFHSWLANVAQDEFLIVSPSWLTDAGIAQLARRRAGLVLGTCGQVLGSSASSRTHNIYLPPVCVQLEDGTPNENGVAQMERLVKAILRALGLIPHQFIAADAMTFLAMMSGGVPGHAHVLLSRVLWAAKEQGVRVVDKNIVEAVAAKIGDTILPGIGASAMDRLDQNVNQLLIVNGAPVEVVHPLVELAKRKRGPAEVR